VVDKDATDRLVAKGMNKKPGPKNMNKKPGPKNMNKKPGPKTIMDHINKI